MLRIALMVIRLILKVPYYLYLITKCGKKELISYEEGFQVCKKVTKKANKAGRVKIER